MILIEQSSGASMSTNGSRKNVTSAAMSARRGESCPKLNGLGLNSAAEGQSKTRGIVLRKLDTSLGLRTGKANEI
jgi:hypothetical protein